MTHLLVTGGRSYPDRARVFAELDRRAPDLVLHGGAGGADRWAGEWADDRGIPCISMSAPWKRLQKAAGPTRNGWLLTVAMRLAQDHARLVVLAFPGGDGTADMVRRAWAVGVEIIHITGEST